MVDVVSNEDVIGYKRNLIISFEDRCEIIRSINIVDQVIEKCPLIVTKKFIEEHNIDMVVHGFANEKDYLKQKSFYENILNKFSVIKYYDKISTTDIIKNIKNNY